MHIGTSVSRDVIQKRFADVIKCFGNGDMNRALRLIDRHIKRDPHYRESHLIKMEILECMGRWGDIIDGLDCIPGMPKSDIALIKARMYSKLGRIDQSLEAIDIAEKEESGPTARTYAARADVLATSLAAGHPEMIDEAVRCAEAACRLDEENGEYHTIAAAVLFVKHANGGNNNNDGDGSGGGASKELLKRSLRHGKKALRLGDTSHITYYNIGRVYITVQKHDKAIKYFRRALKINPGYSRARGMIGMAMAHQSEKPYQHYLTAIRHINNALSEDQSMTFLLKGLGSAYNNLGDFKMGVSYLEEYAKTNPDDFENWFMLVSVYITMENMDDASRCHEMAAKLNPKTPSMESLLQSHRETVARLEGGSD